MKKDSALDQNVDEYGMAKSTQSKIKNQKLSNSKKNILQDDVEDFKIL